MNIQFLGTGAGDFRLAEDAHNDHENIARVRELGGRNLRYASQALITPDLLIDFYSDSQLRRFSVEVGEIRHLLITHCHWDHFHPPRILQFASGLPWPLEVYGNETAEVGIEFASLHEWDGERRFRKRSGEANLRFHRLTPGQTVTVGEARITPVLANHHVNVENRTIEERAFNYVVERDGRTLFYGLDTSYVLPDTLDILRSFRFDLAVFDATFGNLKIDPATSGHLNFPMLRETIAEFRDLGIVTGETAVYGSHVSLGQVAPHDDIAVEVEDMGFALAWDGLRVEV